MKSSPPFNIDYCVLLFDCCEGDREAISDTVFILKVLQMCALWDLDYTSTISTKHTSLPNLLQWNIDIIGCIDLSSHNFLGRKYFGLHELKISSPIAITLVSLFLWWLPGRPYLNSLFENLFCKGYLLKIFASRLPKWWMKVGESINKPKNVKQTTEELDLEKEL